MAPWVENDVAGFRILMLYKSSFVLFLAGSVGFPIVALLLS